MKKVKFIIFLVVLFLIVAFVWSNQAPVSVKFFSKASPEVPFIFVLLGTLIVGAVLATAIDFVRMARLQGQNRRQGKTIKKLKQEIATLKSIPVKEVEKELAKTEEPGEEAQQDNYTS